MMSIQPESFPTMMEHLGGGGVLMRLPYKALTNQLYTQQRRYHASIL